MPYTDESTACISWHSCLRIAHLKEGYCSLVFMDFYLVFNGKMKKMQFVLLLKSFSHFSVLRIIVDFSIKNFISSNF